ncbi:MAG TPA: group 1 truncated hemoglobin [Candidatus Binatia bacterium]|jgi:hemoglobin
MTEQQSLFEKIGGEEKVRQIIETFVDRVFEDRMIGFFFRNANRARIKQMEYQLIAKFLGADVQYHGKPLQLAHGKHPIMGGHFARRRQILKETLESYKVPEPVIGVWLEHTDRLRPLVTTQQGSGCDPVEARQRALAAVETREDTGAPDNPRLSEN